MCYTILGQTSMPVHDTVPSGNNKKITHSNLIIHLTEN